MKGKRAPFSRRVNNATDIFYEQAAYIKACTLEPLYPVNRNTISVVVTVGGEPVCQLARELLLRAIGAKPMHRMVLGLFTALAVCVSVTVISAQSKDQSKKQPAKQEQKTVSMCGFLIPLAGSFF